MADELDLTVVAEGLEEEDQLQTLTDRIPYGQGFLLGRPRRSGPELARALTGFEADEPN